MNKNAKNLMATIMFIEYSIRKLSLQAWANIFKIIAVIIFVAIIYSVTF